jgi:hypothetical protein
VGVRHRLIGKVARLVWRIGKPRTIGVRALLLDRDGGIPMPITGISRAAA